MQEKKEPEFIFYLVIKRNNESRLPYKHNFLKHNSGQLINGQASAR